MVGELVTLVRKLSSEEKRLWSGRTCELLLRTVITGHQFQHYQPYAKFQGSLVTFFFGFFLSTFSPVITIYRFRQIEHFSSFIIGFND